jgi:hypothetical protein
MGKRGRDEDDGAAVEQLVVKPDTVCEAILRETRTWRDKCNSLYEIESKMYISKDQIVLKVGFFDEISCSQVLSLSSLKLPGNYSIRSFECDLKKQLVVFTVTRGAKAARVAHASHDANDGEQLLRLRTVFDVKEADAPVVLAALQAVTRGFATPAEWRLMRCAHRPALYVMYVAVTAQDVPDEAVRAAAEYHGVVDFDNKQIVFTVEKKQSDIF